jgi:hypothetical protein
MVAFALAAAGLSCTGSSSGSATNATGGSRSSDAGEPTGSGGAKGLAGTGGDLSGAAGTVGAAGAGGGAGGKGGQAVIAGSGGGLGPVSGTGGGGVAGAGGGGGAAGAGGGRGAAGAGGADQSAGGSTADGGALGGDASSFPAVLPLFSAPDVPARGPKEAAPNPRVFNGAIPMLPGKGLAQHPFIWVGEDYDRIVLVNNGAVAWTYDTAPPGPIDYELDDIWVLSNGDVLYSHMHYVEELTPTKRVVFHYAPPNGEIHTVQPIGRDKVLFGLNVAPAPKLQIYNKTTNQIEAEYVLTAGTGNVVHTQMRRVRQTAAGTYLVGFLANGVVKEYQVVGNTLQEIWSYQTPRPWSVVRLRNGNTLIQDETQKTCKEVTKTGPGTSQVVWSLAQAEVQVPGANVGGGTQSCERLDNGDTVMFFYSTQPGQVQAAEVTQAKQLVWALEDWKDFGDGTSAQFLDQAGVSEIPGSTQH